MNRYERDGQPELPLAVPSSGMNGLLSLPVRDRSRSPAARLPRRSNRRAVREGPNRGRSIGGHTGTNTRRGTKSTREKASRPAGPLIPFQVHHVAPVVRRKVRSGLGSAGGPRHVGRGRGSLPRRRGECTHYTKGVPE